jgi:membrane-associated protein
MSWIRQAIDLFLNLDKYLAAVTRSCGNWTYALLFLIVFCETGLVVTPFLPGDSLLFAAGALSAQGIIHIRLGELFVLLAAAAILGDTVNYWIGHRVGPRAFRGNVRFLKKEHLDRTREFYERHGGKTIILARFIPIIRTFAPFVAGIGAMNYARFIVYNIIGGAAWVALCLFLGYYFGNLPFVKERFHFVILAIILISVLPIVLEYLRSRSRRPRDGGSPALGALPLPPEKSC